MTTLRGSVTVKRMNRAWTLTMVLQSTKTLVQEIVGNQPAVDWTEAENSPVVYPLVFSSTSSSPILALSNAKWYYDGTLITEADERFEITTYRYAGTTDVPALKIKSNLGLSMEEDKVIRCEVTATVNGSEVTASGVISVSRRVSSASTYTGEIASDNGAAFSDVITSLNLTANLRYGGQAASDYTVEWYRVVPSDDDGTPDGLESLGKTGKTITVTKDEVNLREVVLARFKVSNSVVYEDTLTLVDLSDPYEIIYEHSNPGAIVDETNGLTTTVSVVNAVTKEEIPGFDQAAFALYNGTELVRSQEKSSSMSFKTYWSDLDGVNVDSLTLEVEVFDE